MCLGPGRLLVGSESGPCHSELLSRLKMKQPCMRWTICLQKCDENCLTGQTVCFQLRIKPYLNSGVMRIIPQAANYRNLLLRHPAAPGMKIWPTTAHRTVPTHLHASGRWRVKTSPFTCHHKYTPVRNEDASFILTEGRGAIVSPTMKSRLLDLLYSRLSVMKHVFRQPDVSSLHQRWQTALLQPFLRKKKAPETVISVSIILIFWQRRVGVLHHIAQGHFITSQHTPGTR